ncbi:MAG: hypothetical protein PHS93_07405 [Candidatus Omnitrophica bacterium]|nr:hypothetical protein [Candidatus Omnitrophota bacterium]MDD5352966.1 hypothetical protein [Candidatus Omnitrophota bacterium]MDD5550565.1 hypothetical protein [Candidatus Omnitrophota bacterium]
MVTVNDSKINPVTNNRKTSFFFFAAVLFVLTLAMFGQVLFSFQNRVFSRPDADLALQFIPWREFGFGELRKGNLALWNPYIFSGMPYLGESQSALLYPLNLIYIFTPLAKAINISIVLHIFLGGIFMYLWVSRRKLHPLACFLSSSLFMFCGAHFLHIYVGHLPNLCAIIWVPLIFLAIDGLYEDNSFKWCLLGIFAIAMQILAGHPQYVFYTAVAVLIYSVFCLINTKQRLKLALGIFIMYAGAFMLTAVQILSTTEATAESVRRGGIPFEFASMFSFPPENLITLLTPNFFGDNISFPYWGRCYLWEMSLFISVTALILAIYGAIYGNKNLRRFSLAMAIILILFSLGSHTPLFRFLYNFIPGFNLFRGNSKFILLASLFIILLSGIGMDKIIRSKSIPKAIIIALFLAGISLLAATFCLQNPAAVKTNGGLWSHILKAIQTTHESYLLMPGYNINPDFIRKAAMFATKNLFITASILLVLALLFILRRLSHRIAYVIAIMAVIEIFLFAKHSLPYFDPASIQNHNLNKFLAEYPGDYRIIDPNNPNNAMQLKIANVWGYDPGVLKRYAEFMAFTQGINPDQANQYLDFHYFHPLYNMLRCRYFVSYSDNGMQIVDNNYMPHCVLIHDWLLITKRDDILRTMQKPGFNPAETVILEKQPNPLPVKYTESETVQITDSSTDHLILEADLPSPAILLVTDAYSKGWRAKSLKGSVQKNYEVMPANYILRAIPLSAGHHHLRLEYMPLGFQVGKWISLVSLFIYIGLLGWYFRKTLRLKS